MNELEKILQIALAEEGYLEKASNSNLDDKTANAGSNNYTKYARDLDNIGDFYNGKKNGYAWCDVFVDWCFVKSFGVDRALELTCQPKKSCGAGCGYSLNYYKNKNQFYSSAQKGDQIFFKNSSGSIQHTGLVYDVDKTYVYTIEGNTSKANGVIANGGGVAKKKYKLNYSLIAGYGRPNYKNESKSTQTNNEYDKYTDEELAKMVWEGKLGNGDERKQLLGDRYANVQALVNKGVGKTTATAKKYIMINTASGVWCRKGIGFGYSKYKVIPNKTKCELLSKNCGTKNGYNWDKILYNGVTVYLPNKWNTYL